jgi:hypothetical protein
MTQFVFDASQVAPQTGFDPVPAGWYNVMVDEAEMKPTRDGAGTRLNVRYVVLDGQYQGRKVYHGLNLQHSNPQTVEIAYKQLSALCHAIGRLQIQATEHLLQVPLKIKVKVRPADGQYDEQNDITQWKNINEQVGAAPAPSAAPGAPAGWAPPPAAPAPAAPAPAGWGAPPAAPAAPAGWGAPPAPAATPPAPAAAPAAPAAPGGWTPPAAPQPWAQGQPQQPAAPAAPAAAAPAAPTGVNPAQGAAPPWHRPQG